MHAVKHDLDFELISPKDQKVAEVVKVRLSNVPQILEVTKDWMIVVFSWKKPNLEKRSSNFCVVSEKISLYLKDNYVGEKIKKGFEVAIIMKKPMIF